MKEEDFKKLILKALKMKNDILMEEPCPIYENDIDNEENGWVDNDK